MTAQKDKNGYYISSGQDNKMFTLRRNDFYYDNKGVRRENSYHVCNLATEIDLAISKAKEKTGFTLSSPEGNLFEIERAEKGSIDHSIIKNWGKLTGKSIYVIDTNSLLFWHDKNKRKKYLSKTVELVETELEGRFDCYVKEQIIEFKGENDRNYSSMSHFLEIWGSERVVLKSFFSTKKFISKIKYNQTKIENQKKYNDVKLQSDHVGNLGERMTKSVTFEMERNGSSQYGSWSMYRFKDDNGNIIVYFGSTTVGFFNKGDKVDIAFTVKNHDSYNNEKQTKISRVKVVK